MPQDSGCDPGLEVVSFPEDVSAIAVNYQKKIARLLFEISRLPGINRLKVRGDLPAEFIRLYAKAMALFDESVQFLLAHLRHHGFSVKCRAGCAYCCCNMPSGISAAELVYLYFGMHESGAFPRYYRRCFDCEEKWRMTAQREMAASLKRFDPSQKREAVLKEYNRLKQYCPFLQESLCGIYPYRPIACRMHFSLSQPSWCNPSHFQNPFVTRFNLEPAECVAEALERLDESLALHVSDLMVCGLLELTINVMHLEPIRLVQ